MGWARKLASIFRELWTLQRVERDLIAEALASTRRALLATHNSRSGGCRYFASSFDSLSQRCGICEPGVLK